MFVFVGLNWQYPSQITRLPQMRTIMKCLEHIGYGMCTCNGCQTLCYEFLKRGNHVIRWILKYSQMFSCQYVDRKYSIYYPSI